MKIILLFEILGLMLFGSIVLSDVQAIQNAEPLPVATPLPNQIIREEVAQITLNDTEISVLYHPYTGYSLIHPTTQKSIELNSFCLDDKSACLFIDYYSQYTLKTETEIMNPDEIFQINHQDGTDQIKVYFFHPNDIIYIRPSYHTEDIVISCYDPQYCRNAENVTAEQILQLSTHWKMMSDADKSRYARYFVSIFSISNTLYQLDPVYGSLHSVGESIGISLYKNNQGKHFVKIQDSEGFSYYELNDDQFSKLTETLKN